MESLKLIIENFKESCMRTGEIENSNVEKCLQNLRNEMMRKVAEIVRSRGILEVYLEELSSAISRELNSILLDTILFEIESNSNLIGIESILTLNMRISDASAYHSFTEELCEKMRNSQLPFSTLILFQDHGFNVPRSELIANNMNFYMEEIVSMVKEPENQRKMLIFFDGKVPRDCFKSKTEVPNIFQDMVRNWIEASFNQQKFAMFSNFQQGKNSVKSLLIYVLDYLLFEDGEELSDDFTEKFLEQDQFCASKFEGLMKSEFGKLTEILTFDMLSTIIEKVTNDNLKMNWTNFLKIVSSFSLQKQRYEVFLIYNFNEIFCIFIFSDQVDQLKSFIDANLMESLEKRNAQRNFLIFLLIARQVNLENYERFYDTQFRQNNDILSCAKKLGNLIENFNFLVPFEPHWVLRTHNNNPINSTSGSHKEKINDYQMLGKMKNYDSFHIFLAYVISNFCQFQSG